MRTGRGRSANHAYRTRVGRWCGKGAESYDETHVKAARGVGDDVDEIAPVKVGLGSDQEQDVRAVAVAAVTNLNLGPRQFSRDAVDDARERTSGPLVDEVLGVKGREYFGGDCLEHRRDRGTRRDARVDPSLETDDEDWFIEVGIGEKDDPVVDFVVHQFSKVRFAVSASIAICAGNPSTLP